MEFPQQSSRWVMAACSRQGVGKRAETSTPRPSGHSKKNCVPLGHICNLKAYSTEHTSSNKSIPTSKLPLSSATSLWVKHLNLWASYLFKTPHSCFFLNLFVFIPRILRYWRWSLPAYSVPFQFFPSSYIKLFVVHSLSSQVFSLLCASLQWIYFCVFSIPLVSYTPKLLNFSLVLPEWTSKSMLLVKHHIL